MSTCNIESFKTQPRWFQRSLGTSLDALSYTNNVLLVTALLGVLGGIFLIAFAGDVLSMSEAISSISDIKRKYLSEKVDVVSSDVIGSSVVITLTNRGEYPVEVLGVLDGVGNTLNCVSNNSDVTDFVILPEQQLLEVTCVTVVLSAVDAAAYPDHYVVTDTHQIVKVDGS